MNKQLGSPIYCAIYEMEEKDLRMKKHVHFTQQGPRTCIMMEQERNQAYS